jgi:rubrerythrin
MLKLRNEESAATLHYLDAKMREQTVSCLERYFRPEQYTALLKSLGHPLSFRDPASNSLITEQIGRIVHVRSGLRQYWVCNWCGRRVEKKETARRHLCREAIYR